MNLEGVLVEDQKNDTLLSAGKMRVRVTDWFFLKDHVVLHYIELNDAVVYLNRADSVWNYQYILDYFSGGPSTGKKQKAIELNFKKVKFTNVTFLKKDEWRGEDMQFNLASMDLDADEINLNTKKIEINSLDFSDPIFSIKNYTGKKPKKIKVVSNDEPVVQQPMDSALQWNAEGWAVHIDKLKINNGDFKNIKQIDGAYNDFFDGRNIDFAAINATFSNVIFNKDTLTTAIQLSTKERSGFEVKSMIADAKLTPNEMSFDKLEIKTNNSIIRDYFSMKFEDFSDMNDFLTKIRMQARFEEAEIDSDDIGFFAPEARSWNKKIKVSGLARGTVDDLFGNEMTIQAGNNTYLNGDISLTGLPDINKTFIDFKANSFRTTYGDVATFLPRIRKITMPRLQSISYLDFNGSFTGFIKDFVTYGTIRTNLGTIKSDLNMKLPDGKQPFYSGNIASQNFNLGQFINDPKLGTISFSGTVKGTGIALDKISADIDGKINNIVYNNYRYENITAKGTLNKKIFEGAFAINDSNAVAALNGIVDLSGKVPRFNFIADVDTINLKQLNILQDNYTFKGKLDFNFSSDNIDNFLGNANIRNGVLKKDGKAISFDSLTINSEYIDGSKNLTIRSNEFEGNIVGDFSLSDLPNAFKLFLNKYYPAYITEPVNKIRDQSFTFNIKTNYVSDLLNLFDTTFQGFNNSEISGKLDTRNNLLELNTYVPAFAYKQFEFQNVNIKGNGTFQNLSVSTTIDHLKVSDSLSFPFTQIDLFARNDSTNVRLITESDNKNIQGGSINALVRTFDDGFALKFDTSNFILNGKRWAIEENGELEMRSNKVSYGEIVLKESNQEIRIKTQPSHITDGNDIKVDLKNFNVGDVATFLVKTNKIEGAVSGDIIVEDPTKNFHVSSDLVTDQLRVDKDSIGQIMIHADYSNKTGNLTANGKTVNPNEKLDFDLSMFLKNLPTDGDDVINIKPERYPVKIAERFIGTLFTNLDGFATGPLKIVNPGSPDAKYIGRLKLEEGGLKVKFTQVYYKLSDGEINFTEDALDIGEIKLIDTVTHNTATLTDGILRHRGWRDMVFDIKARVDNRPMLLLNTTRRDNSSFYGYALGTGTFELTGPQSNMRMKIEGKASETDSSYITIPNTTGKETGIADFLIERKYGRELNDTVFKSNETNLTYDVDITGNPKVNVKVVIDELTNDEINGRGTGNLRIFSNGSDMTMRGRFDINEGVYNFSFQSFFKKPFELNKNGNNYIAWDGDPYHPIVNIEAVYKTKKEVDFGPIVAGTTISSFKDYVYVIAKMRGDLFKPDITFALDFPSESYAKKDPTVAFVIDKVLQNENELNKQVAFLVVFNNFAPSSVSSSLGIGSGVDIVVNSISDFLSAQINGVLNNILSNKLKIPGLYVNFSGSLYNPNPFGDANNAFNLNRTNLNVSVGKSLFNDRVVLTFEGNYDVPFQSSGTNQITSDFLTNFTTEFLINKSGTIRATIFYKENVDLLTGITTSSTKSRKYGSSLSFRKDFNRIGDIFRRKKKPVSTPPADTTNKEGN